MSSRGSFGNGSNVGNQTAQTSTINPGPLTVNGTSNLNGPTNVTGLMTSTTEKTGNLNVTNSTAPSAPVAGQTIYAGVTTGTPNWINDKGEKLSMSGMQWLSTGGGSATNTTTRTNLAVYTIPANTIAGTNSVVYRMTTWGTVSTDSGAHALTLNVFYGTNTNEIVKLSNIVLPASLVGASYQMEFLVNSSTAGNMVGTMKFTVQTTTDGTTGSVWVNSTQVNVPISGTTSNNPIGLAATWGTASANNSIVGGFGIIERLL